MVELSFADCVVAVEADPMVAVKTCVPVKVCPASVLAMVESASGNV